MKKTLRFILAGSFCFVLHLKANAQEVFATAQTSGVNGMCALCGVTNQSFAINNSNLTDYSLFNITTGLAGVSVYQSLIFPARNAIAGGDSLIIRIGASNSPLTASLFAGVSVQTYNGTIANNDGQTVGNSNLRLINAGQYAEIVLIPRSTFDRVRITLSSTLVGTLNSFRIYYAYKNTVPPPTLIYVDATNGSDTNTGLSWAAAYKTLTAAMAITTADSILVAKGTYYTTGATANGSTNNSTFAITRGGLKLYGGYPTGGGTRNAATNPTILSGNNTSYHVMVIAGLAATADSVVVDGFTLSGGNAAGSGTDIYNSASVYQDEGGGLFTIGNEAKVSIRDCTFSGNSADGFGGGILNYSSSPGISNCTFSGNSAPHGNGGGIYNYNSSPAISNCIFSGNSASGIFNIKSSPTISNCIFSGNKAPSGPGGAIWNGDDSSPVIVNSTFYNNTASTGNTGGIYNTGTGSKPNISNSIFWGNSGSPQINDISGSSSTVTYSDVQGTGVFTGTGNINADPLFVSATNLQLNAGSPAINTGSNAAIPAGITTDISGNPRIMTGKVDMGAYEAKTLIYVDATNGSDSNNGTTWLTAYKTLTAAMAVTTADSILVAKGTYYTTGATASASANNSTFAITRGGLKLYGGYPTGGGTRNAATNPTILSGNNTSYHIMVIAGLAATADSVVVDGFAISAGNAVGTGTDTYNLISVYQGYGGGLFVAKNANGARVSIRGCTISGNSATYGGGGIFNLNSAPAISNCIFSGNSATNDGGGGIFNNTSSPAISQCTFSDNSASSGGGINNENSSPAISNCTFSGNSATNDGGGIHNGASSPSISNCIFSGNTAPSASGGAIYNYSSSPVIVNSTFYGNTTNGGNTGSIYCYGTGMPSIRNSIFWGNSGSTQINDAGGSSSTVTYSDVQGTGVFTGTGNINANPLFVSATNLQLSAGSPAINTGSNAAIPAGITTDIAGNPRIYGGTVDMGAYENKVAPQPITLAPFATVTYGAADITPVATSISSVPIIYFSSNTAVATIVNGNIHITGAGTTDITASQGGGATGTASLPPDAAQPLTVKKADLTVTANNQSKTYGTTDPTLTYIITGGALVGTDALSGTLTRAAGENVGTYGITIGTLSAGGSYTLTYADANLTINPAAITVTANPQSKNYGTTDPTTLTYTISSGALVGSDALPGALTRAPGENAGTYPITIGTLSAGGNYTLTYAGDNLVINPAALTITANNQTKTYDGVAYSGGNGVAYTGFALGENSANLSGALAYGGTAQGAINVGNYVIVPSGLTSGNYTISYLPGTLLISSSLANTLSFNAQAPASTLVKTYGDADVNGSAVATSGLAATYTSSNTAVATINALGQLQITGTGTTLITAAQAGNVNYAPAPNISFTLQVNKQTLTITAANQTKVYDGSPYSGGNGVSYAGFVNGDGPAATGGALTYSGSAQGAVNTGNYTIVPAGLSAANYSFTYLPGTLSIISSGNNVLTFNSQSSGGNVSLTYGNGIIDASAEATSGLPVVYTSANTAVAQVSATGQLSILAAGSAIITASQPGDANHAPATPITFNLTVLPKALTITANNTGKVYDATPYSGGNGVAYTGFITGEGPANLQGALTYAGTAQGAVNVGSYFITPAGLSAANYAITYKDGSLTVTRAALVVAGNDQTKTYDGLPYSGGNGLTYMGFAGNDGPASLGTATTYAGTSQAAVNAGAYSIIPPGLTSDNYSITYTNGTLTINPAALTITANNQTKTYGQANPAMTVTYNGFAAGDTQASLVTLPLVSTTATISSPAGSYPITVSGAAGNNYAIAYVNGTLTIGQTAQAITLTPIAPVTYGAADLAPMATSTNNSIPITYASDNTAVAVIVNGSIHIVGAGTANITASQAGNANFPAARTSGTLTVNKALLTVTAANQTRAYGTANPLLPVSYNGFVNGDTPASLTTPAIAATAAVATSAPGSYSIVPGGATSANYSLTYVPGVLTVSPLTSGNLTNLVISQGNISPAFDPSTLAYKASVGYLVSHISLTSTFDATASATINGAPVAGGSPYNVSLNTGYTNITIVVTAQDGATKTTYTLLLYRAEPPAAIVPNNILTPNSDGKNDYWIIKDIELYPQNSVTVYDKAGRTVYAKHGYTNDWAGTLNGSPLAQGTYYFIVGLAPGTPVIKGFVTILRSR